jgi:sec-independent protein translocase protein TatA
MFGEIGIEKLFLLLGVVLLLFGAKRLPEIGASMGQGIRAFKRGVTDARDVLDDGLERGRRSDVPAEEPESARDRGGAGDGPKRLIGG